MKKVLCQVCMLAIFLLGSYSAFAQENMEVTRGEKQSKTAEITSIARELATYGQQNEDPYSLVAAAQMLLQYNVNDAGTDRVEAEEGQSDAPEDAKQGAGIDPVALNASDILALAESFADRGSSIMQVIDDLKKQAASDSRGYAYGNGYIKGTWNVPAHGYRDFNWTFTGGEFAEILFIGDGDTDIDVYVYDSSGRRLGQDESYDDEAYFTWTPPYTKQYTFRVVNRGSYTNSVYIVSN